VQLGRPDASCEQQLPRGLGRGCMQNDLKRLLAIKSTITYPAAGIAPFACIPRSTGEASG
jgi:hypothetical protein